MQKFHGILGYTSENVENGLALCVYAIAAATDEVAEVVLQGLVNLRKSESKRGQRWEDHVIPQLWQALFPTQQGAEVLVQGDVAMVTYPVEIAMAQMWKRELGQLLKKPRISKAVMSVLHEFSTEKMLDKDLKQSIKNYYDQVCFKKIEAIAGTKMPLGMNMDEKTIYLNNMFDFECLPMEIAILRRDTLVHEFCHLVRRSLQPTISQTPLRKKPKARAQLMMNSNPQRRAGEIGVAFQHELFEGSLEYIDGKLHLKYYDSAQKCICFKPLAATAQRLRILRMSEDKVLVNKKRHASPWSEDIKQRRVMLKMGQCALAKCATYLFCKC